MRFLAWIALGLIAGVQHQSAGNGEFAQAILIGAFKPDLAENTAEAEPWSASQIIQPQVLAARISKGEGAELTIIHVGFSFQFRSKHIPGSVFAGPGIRPQGLAMLEALVKDLPRNREIILYCGCCPWADCPNITPAFRMLHGLGFDQAKVLMIHTNFAKDWIERGFPVEDGSRTSPTEGKGK